MPNGLTVHRVYKAINRPLTIAGAERRLFFLSVIMGGAAFNYFGSLITGVGLFLALYLFARWATATDPEILRIILNSSRFKCRYDPGKYDATLTGRSA